MERHPGQRPLRRGRVSRPERSGIQKLDSGSPIRGYGFGYGFDSIGNRTASSVDGASGQRQTTYVANELNQYSSISSPGFEHLIGAAAPNATVTANWTPEGNPPPALQPSDIIRASRQSQRWYVELDTDNDPDPVWREATVRGVVREGIVENGVAKDAIQEDTREIFIPAATQALTHDADGNLLSDGRWNYSWDANNRLVAVESVTATPDARKRKVEYAYDYMGRLVRRIERSGFDQGRIIISCIPAGRCQASAPGRDEGGRRIAIDLQHDSLSAKRLSLSLSLS